MENTLESLRQQKKSLFNQLQKLETLGAGQFHFVIANVEKATASVQQKSMQVTLNTNGAQPLRGKALPRI